jgi:GT2 family glycosyltransferase
MINPAPPEGLGAVVIGRNEGERLRRCLASVGGLPCVYVDSGSTDGSVAMARGMGVEVLELAVPPVFTAARARNEGLARLLSRWPELRFVQMVDGDCELREGWINAAAAAITADPGCAAVFGRRRERFPDRSVYNALCDDEWNVPLGEAAGCGGDALFRIEALRAVSGYDPAMIAGEDSELSMRMRKAGWRILRIAAEMTWHDAAILRFGQWWQRARRGGHGFAEMAWRHPDARWPDWPRTVRRILLWGGLLPVLAAASLLLAILLGPGWLLLTGLLLAPWPLQMARIALRSRRAGLGPRVAAANGALLMLGKIPEFLGVLRFHRNRLSGRGSTLIEYKGPAAA